MKPLLALIFGLFSACPAMAAEPPTGSKDSLGRLFFSPARRAELDRQRQFNVQAAQTLEGSTMSLDGAVVRSSGKRTFWINKHPQDDANTPVGVSVTPRAANPGNATLSASGETSTDLKVGESINRASREKRDGIEGGILVVKPARR